MRPAGVSSTDDEHRAALARAQEIKHFLAGEGWPDPIEGDSSNGAHLLYHIDLANDSAAHALVTGCLEALDLHFSDTAVKIDTSVGNAARIWKLYGTLAAKGSSTPERPHRLARILAAPATFAPVTEDLLGALAATRPLGQQVHGTAPSGRGSITLDLARWIDEHRVPVVSAGPWRDGRKWILNPCPFNPEHANRSAYIVQFGNGAIAAGCHHDGCRGNGWRELRAMLDPEGEQIRGRGPRGAHHLEDGEVPTSSKQNKPNDVEVLVQLAEDAELFHTPDGEAFASFEEGGHRETWPLRSRGFRLWLATRFFDETSLRSGPESERETGRAPSSDALNAALLALEGRALFQGTTRPVFLRVGEQDGVIYLDLCNSHWEAVAITPDGWQVVQDPPVRFRRSRGMLALSLPVRGGTIAQLRPFVNVAGDEDFILLISWLLAAFRPRGPYPVLVLSGEQGSSKSTTARVLRRLIDTNKAPLRSEPRDGRDLMISAVNSWCIGFDNLSHVPPWLSDALCRLATGGGFGTRELYSDSDEVILDAIRPTILTGIEDFVTRPDLIDRSVFVTLPALPDEARRPEEEFWADFEGLAPLLLGALLDAVVTALARLPSLRLERSPRMADFARWAAAGASALGWTAEAFLNAYAANRRDANAVALEAAPLGVIVRAFVEHGGGWSGTATDLLKLLADRAPEDVRRQKGWPTGARTLANALRRLAPNLRHAGIDVTFDRANDRARSRIITLTRLGATASAASTASDGGSPAPLAVGQHRPHTVRASSETAVPGGLGADGADAAVPQPGNGGACDRDEVMEWTG